MVIERAETRSNMRVMHDVLEVTEVKDIRYSVLQPHVI